MKLRLGLCHLVLAVGFWTAAPATAQVEFFLDQSNRNSVFPDGENYLSVTISESGEDIRFDITILDPVLQFAGDNFGIQSFGFNLADGATMIDPYWDIVGLPGGWSAQLNTRQDGFGTFEVVSQGTGWSRASPTLTFFIVGVAGDRPEDYVAMSTGNARQGNQLFSARIAGFDPDLPIGSAFFAGSTLVPLPASVLFLFPSLGVFFVWLRRQRRTVRRRSSTPVYAPAV